MPKCDFNKVAKAPLLKSHFGMGFAAYFLEHLILRTPLEGCFC